MPRTGERGGPQTRAKISEVATRLFLDRGFDAVTVADVAREAGVSSVTVFKHFPRKEDLLLDRSEDAHELLRGAVRERGPDTAALDSLEAMTRDLSESQHALSGLDGRSAAFFRTVAASPALIARAREIAADLQHTLSGELDRDRDSGGNGSLLAAFFIAGYTGLLAENARRLIAGEHPDVLAGEHRARLDELFGALRDGLAARGGGAGAS